MTTYVLPGWIVWADITWRNKGSVDYAPKFRIDLKKGGTWPETWVEGPWVDSLVAKPGDTAVATPHIAIPGNWGPGTVISVKIMMAGKEGEMWGPNGWWRSGVGIDILEVPSPSPDWVEILSVAPYAGEEF